MSETPPILPSGRTAVSALLEAIDFWDQIDRLAPLVEIKGGKHDGQTLAELIGSDPEVQNDLLALAAWLDRKEKN